MLKIKESDLFSHPQKFKDLRTRMNEVINQKNLNVSCCVSYDDMRGKFIAIYSQPGKRLINQWHDEWKSGEEFANRWFISCFIKFNPGELHYGKFKPVEVEEGLLK